MILKMFTIYDRQTEIHHPPIYGHSIGHILRVVGDIFNTPETPFNKHPYDYQLLEIGTYDDAAGKVTPLENNHMICSCADFVRAGSDDEIPNTPSGD